MEIIIIRHGRPVIETSQAISASVFGAWVQAYDQASIDRECQPSSEVKNMVSRCTKVVCSHLSRSIESAKALNKTPDMTDFLFREAEIPNGMWTYPKFKPKTWSIIFRVLQLFGYSANAESLSEIKNRALTCANQLITYAEQHSSVLFIGHGTLNWFIHKQLISMGWHGPAKANSEHWGYGVYQCN